MDLPGHPNADQKSQQHGHDSMKTLDQNQEQKHAPDRTGLNEKLPGDEGVWRNSVLGEPNEWSTALQSYALTLSSFAYPACIFWGDELILLHNEAWTEAGGKAEQGQRQRGRLSPDAFQALSSALNGGQQKKVASHELLRRDAQGQHDNFTVLVSPLFADDSHKPGAAGLLAQMLPRSDFDGDHKSEDGNSPSLGSAKLHDILKHGKMDSASAVFVNQHFYTLTTHKGDQHSFTSWPQSIHPDDYPRVMEAYQEAFDSGKQLRTEFRSLGDQNPWRLLLLTPLGDENLQHVSLREYGGFICSLVDITSEKRAEISERKAAQEAEERRGQQERFIDMISHEIRNPLSAVMHCSEDIDEAISDTTHVDIPTIREAVDTINLCLQHQQNIVNDVLSYSKLDASMLSLVPKPCQPSETLANTLKMFQPEFRKQRLKFEFKIDTSYAEFGIDWVMADMARIGQVVVNLISNAIKFTAKGKGKKQITVMVGASYERPTSYPPNLVFFGLEEVDKLDCTIGSEWGEGQTMYIMVAVKDSGIGISEGGQKRLFERFRQATPKTSDIYGGSGLGLNISRKLCHLHGGEIGISSKEGAGSTFGFFFVVKRSENPGDYKGRSEQQATDDDRLESFIQAQGCAADKNVHPDDVPESIKNPPVEDTVAAPPDRTPQKDHRYEQTLRVSNQVEADASSKSAETSSSQSQSRSDDVVSREKSRTSEMALRPGVVRSNTEGRPKETHHGKVAAKRHVLLVEDNIINQRIVHRKLQAKGFEVTSANNGREAVEAVRKAPKHSTGDKGAFDIILMDQEMPILDGNAATREIRGMEEKGEVERIPILGVTANVRAEQQDEMVNSGMDDVISKPYRVEDLVRKIDEVTKKGGVSGGA